MKIFKSILNLFMPLTLGVGEGGSEDPVWSDSLPENIRDWDEVKNSDTPDKFYDQVSNMRSRLGKSITIPDEDASETDRAIFYDKLNKKVPGVMIRPDADDAEAYDRIYQSLGKPEKPEDYEYDLQDPGDGIKLNTEPIEKFREIAHGMGLNKTQFKKAVEAMTEVNIAAEKASLESRKADAEALKTEWGSEHDSKIESVVNFAKNMKAPQHVVEGIEAGALDSASIKWLHDLSLAVSGEGNPANSQRGANDPVMTPSEAKMKKAEIMNNPDHPYWKGDKTANDLMRSLNRAINPEESRKSAVAGGFSAGVGS